MSVLFFSLIVSPNFLLPPGLSNARSAGLMVVANASEVTISLYLSSILPYWAGPRAGERSLPLPRLLALPQSRSRTTCSSMHPVINVRIVSHTQAIYLPGSPASHRAVQCCIPCRIYCSALYRFWCIVSCSGSRSTEVLLSSSRYAPHCISILLTIPPFIVSLESRSLDPASVRLRFLYGILILVCMLLCTFDTGNGLIERGKLADHESDCHAKSMGN